MLTMMVHEQSEYIFGGKEGNHIIGYYDHKVQADKVAKDLSERFREKMTIFRIKMNTSIMETILEFNVDVDC